MENLIKGRPLHERVVVKLDEAAKVTEGGLLLPEEARQIATTATVIAVGNLVNREGECLEPGDKIIIQKAAGLPFYFNGENYKIMMVHDILFVDESNK